MDQEQIDRIEDRLDRVEGNVTQLLVGQRTLTTGLDDLRREMHVLHEDTIDRIGAIPAHVGPTKAEFDTGLAELRESIGRRLDPLEAAVRRLSSNS